MEMGKSVETNVFLQFGVCIVCKRQMMRTRPLGRTLEFETPAPLTMEARQVWLRVTWAMFVADLRLVWVQPHYLEQILPKHRQRHACAGNRTGCKAYKLGSNISLCLRRLLALIVVQRARCVEPIVLYAPVCWSTALKWQTWQVPSVPEADANCRPLTFLLNWTARF